MSECDCSRDEYGTQCHPADCPTVAWIAEVQRKLAPELDAMAKARRRAEAESRNVVIC